MAYSLPYRSKNKPEPSVLHERNMLTSVPETPHHDASCGHNHILVLRCSFTHNFYCMFLRNSVLLPSRVWCWGCPTLSTQSMPGPHLLWFCAQWDGQGRSLSTHFYSSQLKSNNMRILWNWLLSKPHLLELQNFSHISAHIVPSHACSKHSYT